MKIMTNIIYAALGCGGPTRPRILLVCLLLLTATVLTPTHALAQLRLIDRIGQPTPAVPSISESVARVQENFRGGSVHIDGHVHKRQFTALCP
jgi:hypothetical protein